jgi:methyltransferase (TIGR00027 family)
MGLVGGPSKTAVLAAVGRALHRDDPPPRVLDDHLALVLAGEEALAVVERLRRDMPADVLLAFTRWASVRTRFAEDIVQKAMEDGVQQLVILGAGLDSFAYRRPPLLERLRVFEVDHPSSQAWKRERLGSAGIRQPENLFFAPIDFEVETLREGLESAGFSFGAPAIFTWIGVTMYLTLPAIEATLSTVRGCAVGSKIVLTYDLPRSSLGTRGLALTNAIRDVAADMGEPFISLFEPAEAEALLRRCGFGDILHFGPEDAIRIYFGGQQDMWIGSGAQRIIVATVTNTRGNDH